MKSGPSCALFLSFPDTLRFQRVFRFATQLSQPSAISRPRSNTIHIYLDWHIYFIAIVAVGVYLGVLVHIVNNQLHKIENTMPAVFNPQRPLTKSEYGRRRDETTTVELNKLMASRAYKQFAREKADDSCKPSAVPLLVAAAFAAVILSCIVGISMMGGKAEIAAEIVQVRRTVDLYLGTKLLQGTKLHHHVYDTLVQLNFLSMQVSNPIAATFVDEVCHLDDEPVLDAEITQLANQLKFTEAALDTATQANANLTQSLIAAHATAAIVPECPAAAKPSFMIGTAGPFTIPDLGIGYGVDWPHAGLLATVFTFFLASIISSRRVSRRIQAAKTKAVADMAEELRELAHEKEIMSEELRELAFEKDTAEQSVSILEMELQRKVKQLSEAQAPPKHQNMSTPTPTSPRIRAVKAGGPSPSTQPSRIPTTPNTDTLPPPPRQLVELWLQQRNSIAVGQEQVQTWLELEETCEWLQHEVMRLKAVIEGRDADCSELADRVHDLMEELDEQRKLTLAAKSALKAVRSAGGVISDDESDTEDPFEDSASTQG